MRQDFAALQAGRDARVALQQTTPAAGETKSGGLSKGAKLGIALGIIGSSVAIGFAAGKGPDPKVWATK